MTDAARRRWAGRLGLSAAAVLGAALIACPSTGGSPDIGRVKSARPGGRVRPTEKPKDYLDRPLREQVAAIRAGRLTSAGLTRAYLARIEARDRGERGTHAVIALDPRALERAAALDRARGSGLLRGATILVKDNIDTRGIATTAGSLALAHNIPAKDAFVVKRIRAARGLVLGKANLSEWANFRGNRSTSGWSSLGGQTRNGADPAYNPCGSSSGSAAAVAVGLASAALGTETNGSIICPASVNGVVGFKPTVGLVSRSGVVPISHSQDTVGPITRTVGDAARLMSALAGPDPGDPATRSIPEGMSLDFEAPLAGATLRGKRLGVVGFGFKPDVMALFNAERGRLAAAGAVLVDVALDAKSWSKDGYTVLLHEFKVGINAYLAAHARPGQPATLQGLIDFNEAHAARVMPHFGQEVFLAAQATTGLRAPAYLAARRNVHAKTAVAIVELIAKHNLDALVSPSAPPAWKTRYESGDPAIACSSGPAAAAGLPHLTLPMGRVNGLPVGLSLFGRAWDDAAILALGQAYERLRR